LSSSAKVVPVSRILVIYGAARVLKALGCNTAANRGVARHERIPMEARYRVLRTIVSKVKMLSFGERE
jgi:hypothetical protein